MTTIHLGVLSLLADGNGGRNDGSDSSAIWYFLIAIVFIVGVIAWRFFKSRSK